MEGAESNLGEVSTTGARGKNYILKK